MAILYGVVLRRGSPVNLGGPLHNEERHNADGRRLYLSALWSTMACLAVTTDAHEYRNTEERSMVYHQFWTRPTGVACQNETDDYDYEDDYEDDDWDEDDDDEDE